MCSRSCCCGRKSKPLGVVQGEADSRGLEGRGARLQLRAGRTASTRLQRALHPLPPVSPLAELFAVLSSTLGFKQDTAGNWSK